MSETGWLSQLKDWNQRKECLREEPAINLLTTSAPLPSIRVHTLHPHGTWGLGCMTRRAGASAPLPWLQEGVTQQLLGTGSEVGVRFKGSEEEGLGLS